MKNRKPKLYFITPSSRWCIASIEISCVTWNFNKRELWNAQRLINQFVRHRSFLYNFHSSPNFEECNRPHRKLLPVSDLLIGHIRQKKLARKDSTEPKRKCTPRLSPRSRTNRKWSLYSEPLTLTRIPVSSKNSNSWMPSLRVAWFLRFRRWWKN